MGRRASPSSIVRRRPARRVLRLDHQPADVRTSSDRRSIRARDVPVRRTGQRQNERRRAEITACFGSSIWIPHALSIEGKSCGFSTPRCTRGRGRRNRRKSSTFGDRCPLGSHPPPHRHRRGGTDMAELEVRLNHATRICESPLQLKSNCGTLVIDDFGRHRMP